MTSEEILNKMRLAIKKFGEYTFEDKGASEVMDIRELVAALSALSAVDARKVLEEVHDADRYGAILAGELVCGLDGQPTDWWDTLMESQTLQELY